MMLIYNLLILIILCVLSIFIFAIALRSLFFLIVVLLNLKNKNELKQLFLKQDKLLNMSIRKMNIFNIIYRYISQKKDHYENTVLENEKKNIEINLKLPFISILIASFNEKDIIDKLLYSISKLDYDISKYETIIVDDSIDDTVKVLEKWKKQMTNLKVLYRKKREGWKGGALNKGIEIMNDKSDIALVVDADNILEKDTLQQIASDFETLNQTKSSIFVIQGYPISIVHNNDEKYNKSISTENNNKNDNWISRAIAFRLCQRNLIEFVAKEKINLPLPITGSLFSMKSDILKTIKFSHDLCEDWDLTLDLYLSEFFNNHNIIKNKYFDCEKLSYQS